MTGRVFTVVAGSPEHRAMRGMAPIQDAPKSEGERLLRLTGASNSQVGQMCGVSSPMASSWKNGKSKPNPERRTLLLKAYDIPRTSWDQPPTNRKPKKGAKPPKKLLTPLPDPEDDEEVLSDASEIPASVELAGSQTVRECKKLLQSIRQEALKGITMSERLKLAQAETRVLTLMSKLERDEAMTTDNVVRNHPMWRKMKKTILDTLVRHPDAAKEVLEALKGLGE